MTFNLKIFYDKTVNWIMSSNWQQPPQEKADTQRQYDNSVRPLGPN